MKFIIGQKIGMSQVFQEGGAVAPVTLIKAGPVVVIQVKSKEKDDYPAIQFGFGFKKTKNIKKPQRGHFKDLGNFQFIKELKGAEVFGATPASGDKFDVSGFQVGDLVKVSGVSKGKGFQGVVKRHGFHGGPKSHGQKHSLRAPGSIGATTPQHVLKGKRMAGRMGGERVTVKNLKVIAVDAENNIIAIKGAIPGRKGTFLEIRG
ncbi:MAG: 50S ribosomal protein L3 [bacterium]|nr:50S ribosomal protein L3 [bacterium]